MRPATTFVLGGIVAVACALPDVTTVSSFGEGGNGARAGADAGRGGTAGVAIAGNGGASGKGTGGASGRGSSGGDAGEAGDGAAVGGGGGQTGGVAGSGGEGAAGSGGSSDGGSAGASAAGAGGGGVSGSGGGGGGSGGSSGSGSETCGNGTVEAPEACDDRNASECGQCNGGCVTVKILAAATGSITVTGVVVDGERFILDDGFGAVVFEFDTDGTPGDNPIHFDAPGNPDAIRDALVAAVNDPPNGLAITAVAGNETGEVLLTNDRTGSLGNHAIIDEGSGNALTITGMSGGVGRDCPAGTGCRNANDCAWNHECNGGACVASP